MITKTPSVIQGELTYHSKLTLNMDEKTFTRGFSLDGSNYSGIATITEIFAQMTPTERDAVKKFFRIGTRMTANAGIEPDAPLVDMDIGDEL